MVKEFMKRKIFRQDRESYISFNITFLKYIGLWFYSWENRKLEYLAKFTCLTLVYFIPMVGEIGYAVQNSRTVSQIAEATYLLVAEFMLLAKTFSLSYHRETVLDLVEDLKNEEFAPRCAEHEAIFRRTVSKTRSFVMWTALSALTIGVGANLIPLFEETRILPTSMLFPGLDSLSTPTYEILYLYNVLYRPVGGPLYVCLDLLPAAFMFFGVEQLRILAYDMENIQETADTLKESNDDTAMLNAVKFCIRRHQFILNYVAKVETAFSGHLVLVFFITGVTICMTGARMIMVESFSENPIGWLYSVIFLTVVCYLVYAIAKAGNEINLESENLLISSYKSAVDADPAVKKLFLVFRERCQTPIVINAGPLCTVTLISFTTLMQWSYKVYTALINMENR